MASQHFQALPSKGRHPLHFLKPFWTEIGKHILDWEAELVKELAPCVSESLTKALQLSLVTTALS